MTVTDLAPTDPDHCIDCGRRLTRWDSKHRRRGAICEDRAIRREAFGDAQPKRDAAAAQP
jgi:hypothetical protein